MANVLICNESRTTSYNKEFDAEETMEDIKQYLLDKLKTSSISEINLIYNGKAVNNNIPINTYGSSFTLIYEVKSSASDVRMRSIERLPEFMPSGRSALSQNIDILGKMVVNGRDVGDTLAAECEDNVESNRREVYNNENSPENSSLKVRITENGKEIKISSKDMYFHNGRAYIVKSRSKKFNFKSFMSRINFNMRRDEITKFLVFVVLYLTKNKQVLGILLGVFAMQMLSKLMLRCKAVVCNSHFCRVLYMFFISMFMIDHAAILGIRKL